MTKGKRAGAPSERTRVRRVASRGKYERETIYAILDASYMATVGYHDGSSVRMIPMAVWRQGDHLYIHGSTASQLMRDLANKTEACIVVTHLDGLVLARSGFHHSMNYRSVVIYAQGQAITEPEQKRQVLNYFVDLVVADRMSEVRSINEQELKATAVIAFPLDEAVAKIRTGGPKDDEEDYALPVWAGVIPLKMVAGTPICDDRLVDGVGAFTSRLPILEAGP